MQDIVVPLVEHDIPALRFETTRLSARCLSAVDRDLFSSLYTDAETMRFIGKPLTGDQAARSFIRTLASWRNHPLERAFMTIIERATQRPVGICAITQFDADRTRAEVGIILVTSAHSKGYAREGLNGLVQKAFSVFPLDELYVHCSALNPIVERMVSSIGFVLTQDLTIEADPLLQRVWSILRHA